VCDQTEPIDMAGQFCVAHTVVARVASDLYCRLGIESAARHRQGELAGLGLHQRRFVPKATGTSLYRLPVTKPPSFLSIHCSTGHRSKLTEETRPCSRRIPPSVAVAVP